MLRSGARPGFAGPRGYAALAQACRPSFGCDLERWPTRFRRWRRRYWATPVYLSRSRGLRLYRIDGMGPRWDAVPKGEVLMTRKGLRWILLGLALAAPAAVYAAAERTASPDCHCPCPGPCPLKR